MGGIAASSTGSTPGDGKGGTRNANVGGAGGKGREAGKGSMEYRVKNLERLAVAHDREIQMMSDGMSYVLMIKDEDMKVELAKISDNWTKIDAKRREENAGLDKDKQTRHALGSKRALMFAWLMSKLAAEKPAVLTLAGTPELAAAGVEDNKVKAAAQLAADELAKLNGEQVDKVVLRLTTRHPRPKADKLWIWSLVSVESSKADDLREKLDAMTAVRTEKIIVAKQHSNDGPIVKEIKKTSKGKGKGDGSAAAGDADGGEEDGMLTDGSMDDSTGKAKRKRRNV